ncbi:MAG: sugar-binding protein [Kiritimatiellia bacterium]|jgi:hypothetical protein
MKYNLFRCSTIVLLSVLAFAVHAGPFPCPTLDVPAVEDAASCFGRAPLVSAAGGWTFVSPTNGVADQATTSPTDDADLSYFFRCRHDSGGLLVEAFVRDDHVVADSCEPGAVSCPAWADDAVEIFIDGEMARLPDSRAGGGVHLRHGGEFALVANGAAQSDFSGVPRGYLSPAQAFGGMLPANNWWTGEVFPLPGVGYATRFYIPWNSMGQAKAPDRIGFTISVQDDDDGGRREHALYWTGNPEKPHIDESAYGILVLKPGSSRSAFPASLGWIIATDFVAADGATDVAGALQSLIEANPNRTIFFPDGVYLLSKPIATPADPRRSVTLRLSDNAVLRAAPGWNSEFSMVRLGGIHPFNDNHRIGSQYGLFGGYIDGAGVAKGVSIESGRETRVQNVSIRNALVGLHVWKGANGGSADCDIRDVNITCNNAYDSVGLFVQAHDNSFMNMRIMNARVGVRLNGSGNLLTKIHPLANRAMFSFYEDTVGFEDNAGNNGYDRCYADQFSTGWLFGAKCLPSDLDGCLSFWFDSTPGHPHTSLRSVGKFNAIVDDFWAGFRDGKATNAVLLIGEPGGEGIIRGVRTPVKHHNNPNDAFRQYLRGSVHSM